MTTGKHDGDARRAARPRSMRFAIRLWQEDVGDGTEYRGSVRDVVSGAFRSFRSWSDLTAFMVAQMEEPHPPEADRAGRRWPSER
jgi:hypothetical protein